MNNGKIIVKILYKTHTEQNSSDSVFSLFYYFNFYQFKPNTPVYLACLGGVGEPEHPEKTHATLESLVLKTTMSLGKGASGGGGWVDGWAACAPES